MDFALYFLLVLYLQSKLVVMNFIGPSKSVYYINGIELAVKVFVTEKPFGTLQSVGYNRVWMYLNKPCLAMVIWFSARAKYKYGLRFQKNWSKFF